jgi:DNA helicase-2/ATP-dependent DNA helicase PcrA
MLVGLTKNIEYATSVQNVATFWRRDGTWSWRTDNPAMRRGAPPMPELMPLELI